MTAQEEVAECIQPNGGLECLNWYLSYWPWNSEACLDGWFTADRLRAIADYMDKVKQ